MSCDCLDGATKQPCQSEAVASCHACRKRVCPAHLVRDGAGSRDFCPACALAEGVAPCRAKLGFLTVRDCGAAATAGCVACTTPLCSAHALATPQGVLCAACAKERGLPAEGAATQGRERYYYGGYEPYYWGSDVGYHHRHGSHWGYDRSDAAIFDEHRHASDDTGSTDSAMDDLDAS